MTRRHVIKLIALVLVIALTPAIAFYRHFTRKPKNFYVDQISESIPIPKEIQGQLGFKAVLSRDSNILIVAGNRIMPSKIFGKKGGSVPDGDYIMLLGLRSQIFIAETPFANFRRIWKNKNTSFVSSMSVSPDNSQLAALVYECSFEHPADTIEEIAKLYATEQEMQRYVKDVKDAWGKGYEANIYLFDLQSGDCKKLVNLFSAEKPSFAFFQSVNPRALVWNSDSTLLFSYEPGTLFSIDLAGQRKDVYTLKDRLVASTLHCDSNDTVSLTVVEKLPEDPPDLFSGPAFFVQIDSKGNVIKEEQFSCPPGYFLPEQNITFIGKDKLIFFSMDEESAVLHEVPRIPNIPQKRSPGESSTYFFDQSGAIFSYAVYGEFPTGEILFAKKRIQNDTVTEANKHVPWVELRRFSSSNYEKL